MAARLLIVDDEPGVLYSLQRILKSDGVQLLTASTAQRALDLCEQQCPDAVLLDVRLPDMSGLAAFDRLRARQPRLPVIIMTAYSTAETAIQAVQRGAFEYLLKPVDAKQLREVVKQALEAGRMRQVPAVVEADMLGDQVDVIVGQSQSMQQVYQAIGRAASQDTPVLIVGESGTGKELVSRSIYHYSRRAQGPFLTLHCEPNVEALESELFGHERGALPRADKRRIGRLEQTCHGALFLDEIGNLSINTQDKLLRIIAEQRFQRLGSSEWLECDVRILAATRANLPEMVAAGRFRQELYQRFSALTIRLPPLRERQDDIARLADYFRQRFHSSLTKPAQAISTDAMCLLRNYSWPGNVRELQDVIRHAVQHCATDVIMPDDLPESLRQSPTEPAELPPRSEPYERLRIYVRELLKSGQRQLYEQIHREVDRVLIEEALQHTSGNQVQSAETLGIARMTLRTRLRELGIAAVRGKSGEPPAAPHGS